MNANKKKRSAPIKAKPKAKAKESSKRKSSSKSIRVYRQPFPKEFYCTMKYSTQVTLASTTGTLATHVFRANGLYDPDKTGTGQQPRYFDTLCGANNGTAPYRRYRVLGSRMVARFIATSASYTTGMANIVIGCRPTATTDPSSISEARERKDCFVKLLGSAYSAQGIKTLSFKCSPKKILGIKDLKDDENTSASYTADPVSEVDFFIQQQPIDQASSNSVVVEILIEYITQFFHMSDVADS